MAVLLSAWIAHLSPLVVVHDDGPGGWVVLWVLVAILVVAGVVKLVRRSR